MQEQKAKWTFEQGGFSKALIACAPMGTGYHLHLIRFGRHTDFPLTYVFVPLDFPPPKTGCQGSGAGSLSSSPQGARDGAGHVRSRAPDLRVMIRITDGGVEFFGERVNIRSPAIGNFYVDKDNWIITPDPQGGIELHSADAVARFYRENREVNNVHKLDLVRNNDV